MKIQQTEHYIGNYIEGPAQSSKGAKCWNKYFKGHLSETFHQIQSAEK